MKLLNTGLFLIAIIFTQSLSAQTKKETIPVWGNCGMCKGRIEKAAMEAGASKAKWDAEAKEVKLTYDASKTSSEKIQQAIANAGYDTRDFTAPQSAYDNLHGCCKYDRKDASKAPAACCSMEGCVKDPAACKEKGCCKGMNCCKS
jgi:hypothetical protein